MEWAQQLPLRACNGFLQYQVGRDSGACMVYNGQGHNVIASRTVVQKRPLLMQLGRYLITARITYVHQFG